MRGMSIGPIHGLSASYLQSILSTTLQSAGLTSKTSANSVSSSSSVQSDNSQLSPFAQVLSELQQLQQSDPTKYAQVTQQIASNLQTAAQTAQANGNTTAANQLNQLATDFTTASKSSQLPNVQDLAQAIGGGHHHHHHDASSTDSSNTAGSNSSSLVNQLLAAFEANASQTSTAQTNALNPLAIIQNTLYSAGITATNQ
jgi:hypothetical protein